MAFLRQPSAKLTDPLLSSFASAFTQRHRLIALRFPDTSDNLTPGELLPARLNLTTGLSADTHIDLLCLTANAFVDLKSYLGQPAEVSVLLADGRYRLISGVVLAVANQGSDGGFTTLLLTIGSLFQTLKYRSTSRVFQHLSVPDIVRTIFNEHRDTNPVFALCFDLTDKLCACYPKRELVIQYHETDYAFLRRLLAQEGITYYHRSGATDDTDQSQLSSDQRRSPIVHQLVLADNNQRYRSGLDDTLWFGTDGINGKDSLTSLTARRQLISAMTTLRGYDYQTATIQTSSEQSTIAQGERADNARCTLEDYRTGASFSGTGNADLKRIATLRRQALDGLAHQFTGTGTCRALDVGTVVTIANHPVVDKDAPEDRQFLITALSAQFRNNLPDDVARAWRGPNDESGKPPCLVNFDAIRSSVAFVPVCTREHQQPSAQGPLTATVVGPASEEIYTDELGRIQLQFHFARSKEHPKGGADFNEYSFPWVRVAQSQAGLRFGNQFIPRVGQEVLVEFIDGDINHPVVTGALHNGTHANPHFSGRGSLPANKALSGFKTEGLHDSLHYNELLFDDTTGQSRSKLSSETGKTQLNLGYLVHPRTDGAGEARGQGFELRTDLQGALRANGLLISAAARANASGNQLDRSELNSVLDLLENVHRSLARLAAAHKDDLTETDQFSTLKTDLQNWENGTNTQGNDADPTGAKPIVAVSAPAGMALVSQANIALAAEDHIDVVSAQNVQLSAGKNLLARAAAGISLFAHKLHVKLTAGTGNVQIESHAANIEMIAAKQIILNGLEEIILRSPKITLETSGAKQTWGEGSIASQCTGVHTMLAAKHFMSGPGGGAASGYVPTSAATQFDERIVLNSIFGESIPNVAASILNNDGHTLWSGMTNEKGEADMVQKDLPDNIHIQF